MKKKEVISANYLDFVPRHRPSLQYTMDNQGKITLLQENKGVFHFLAQKILKKPKVSQIHLDEMGNFVWPLIDGTRTVYEIAELVKAEFGDKAEPLYDRLVQYIRNLEMYGFVKVQREKQESLDKISEFVGIIREVEKVLDKPIIL